MKRFLSLLLALTLTVGLLPLSAASAELDSSIEAEPDSGLTEPVAEPPEAEEPEASAPAVRAPATKAVTANGTCGENLTWTLTDDGILTVSGTGAMTDWTSSAPWYSNRSNIQKVVINSGATSIDEYAFSDCTSLTDITIPDSVTSIGDYAFRSCTNLISITIPDSVTSIGDGAFCQCTSLTSITIPDSVTSIGDWAFVYCTSLTGIYVDDSNPTYADIGGVLFNKNLTELICYPIGYSSSYSIPDSVTSIGNDAFAYCYSLTSITIPDSVTSIGNFAFEYCTSLTSITIPDSVTSIGYGAFYGCTSLTSITFKGTVPPSIDSNAFYNVTATAYYPGGELWIEDVRQNYGGNLTWVEYNSEFSGDVDGNGEVNILDVMSVINIITGSMRPTESQQSAADFNGDGSVNILDAMALINQITGA